MKTPRILSLFIVLLAACALLAFAGCASDPASPGVEPEIINGTQSFEFQVSTVRNYTGTWTYTWDNASTTASVDQSSALSGGSATLTIKDINGDIVYTRSMADDGSFETSAGDTGDWILTISLVDASGDLNFRVDEGS
jgi:hypothetical protein